MNITFSTAKFNGLSFFFSFLVQLRLSHSQDIATFGAVDFS